MLLIEADGKALFKTVGIRVPDGFVVASGAVAPAIAGPGPWMVKAQVPVGGRGKVGGIIRCENEAAVRLALKQLLGARIKGHDVLSCRVEAAVNSTAEYYLSLMIDPVHYGIRVVFLSQGGVDVEQVAGTADRAIRLCDLDEQSIVAAIRDLASEESEDRQALIVDVGEKLTRLFLTRELMLAEINPLFFDEAACVAGDAKVVVDLNAVHRQPEIAQLIELNASVYPDAVRKIHDGFDYVEVDPEGEIGLVTTGAGLSMMLIDELTARGGRPLNFCDIRTGQLRGDPQRLIRVFEWIGTRPSVRIVLVNIFAGITDLAEFADLLCTALERTPSLQVPVVARLVGNRVEEAKSILAARRPDIVVEEALDAALRCVDAVLSRPTV
jgi:succinyl-CoA synthetase beta subunit